MRDKMSEQEPSQERKSGAVVSVNDQEIPLANVDRAMQWSIKFEELKSKLLENGKDKVSISGKMAVTRAGFSKLLVAFGGSSSTVITNRYVHGVPGDKDYEYKVDATSRAWLERSGRSCEGLSSCSSREWTDAGEKAPDTFVIDGTASTRSRNRAIGDLLGGSVVSAEEWNPRKPNPFNTATPVPEAKSTAAQQTDWRTEPMSEAQHHTIKDLAQKKYGESVYEAQLFNVVTTVIGLDNDGNYYGPKLDDKDKNGKHLMTKGHASAVIDDLKKPL